ncbi:hypothetical protein ACIO3O_01340 [Streptomyces sp. NPDC087440]|uniref:hypothetical protein n=1 Tax=Streptomyces sp. NPDC087440 TaxID=3365790 RepID=UPI003812704A
MRSTTPRVEPWAFVVRHVRRLEPVGATSCRLTGTTSNPSWYAEQLAALPMAFRITGGEELRHCVRALGQRLLRAAGTLPR